MFEPLPDPTALPRRLSPPRARPTILAVDDAKSVRELLRLHLTNAGYDVITAEDAIIAGKAVLESPPNLIITDLVMPYMNGIEFVRAMQADDTVPDIPVVFLTGADDPGPQTQSVRAAAWLKKPINVNRLLEVVALHVVPPQPAPADSIHGRGS